MSNLPLELYNQLDTKQSEVKLMELFQQDPVLKILLAVLKIIPGGFAVSAGAESVLAMYNQMGIKRQFAFFEELRKDPYKLTEAVIQSEPFIHKSLITYRAIMMTNRKEKIEYLARLLKSSTIDDFAIGEDEYEECLNIITDLSFRELQILSVLDKYFADYPEPIETLDDNTLNPAWKEWETKIFSHVRAEIEGTVSVRKEEMDDILIRISRSGLYKQIGYMYGDNGNGRLTPLFYRIKKLIMI